MPQNVSRVVEGDRVLMRSFAAAHPGVYLRWFNVSDHSVTGPSFRPRRSRTYNDDMAVSIERDDRESSDPALFFECSVIPNVCFSANIETAIDAETDEGTLSSYALQIYTVRSGTHQGKRLVKVRDPETNRYKAAGFLNRDASFTPWNNSIWSDHHILHIVIRNFLNRYRSSPEAIAHSLPIPGAESILVSYELDEDDLRCRQCNSLTVGTSTICEAHLPIRTLGVDGVTRYEVETEEGRRNRLRFEEGAERDRVAQQQRQERNRQEAERQRQLAIEREQEQQRQREEVLASFVPLLSENGTGLIR